MSTGKNTAIKEMFQPCLIHLTWHLFGLACSLGIDLLLLDELGKMELCSPAFEAALAVGESSASLLHPPSPVSRRTNRDDEGVPAE